MKSWMNKRNRCLSNYRVRGNLWRELSERILRENGSTEALSALVALRSDDHSTLLRAEWDPHRYNDVKTARRAFQAVELLRKFPHLNGSDSASRRGAAIRKGREAEELCRSTNIRFRQAYISGRGEFLPPFGVGTVLDRARRKIKYVLDGGSERDCSFRVLEWVDLCSWGPGVTDKVGRFCSAYNKYDAEPSFTRRATRFCSLLMEVDATWRSHVTGVADAGVCSPAIRHSRGNRITSVPKTAQTDRLIAIEPHWNIYFQLGVGKMLRKRLRTRAGIDLTSQEINREGARRASVDGSLATVDLSSASDTVALEVVRHLLPEPWFRILYDLRSPESYWPDTKTWVLNEKFSSMGNGFTFELETLLFWALSQSVVDEMGYDYNVPVYGDDIIIPTECYEFLIEVLTYCGFIVNKRKSFSTSYFRESCGMNAWEGADITPLRLTRLSELAHVFAVINSLRDKGYPNSAGWLEHQVPRDLRLYGPRTIVRQSGDTRFGDAIIASDDIALWDYRLISGQSHYFFWGLSIPMLTFKPHKFRVKRLEPALLYSWTSTSPEGGTDGLFTLRGEGMWRVSRGTVIGHEAGLRRGDLIDPSSRPVSVS